MATIIIAPAEVRIPGFIWVPPVGYPDWQIKITRSDGTIDSVRDACPDASITLGATETIGTFSAKVENFDEKYSRKWAVGNKVEIFADRSIATTKIFRGKIDNIKYSKTPRMQITIEGRHYAAKLLDITVTRQYINTAVSSIVTELFSAYATDFTTTNVETVSTPMTVNWTQKPFWDCIEEICEFASCDCYVDSSLDVHFFESGTKLSTTEAIVHDDNLLETSDYGASGEDIRNRIIVFGQNLGDLPLIYTSGDAISQSIYGIREMIISDTNIRTYEQAIQRANFELANRKVYPNRGTVKSIGLPTLNPGEKLRISDPESQLTDAYKIISFSHSFTHTNGMTTTVTIEKEPTGISKLFKLRTSAEQALQDIRNPFELRYSYNFTFDDETNISSHSLTEISEGYLQLVSGATAGIMTTEARISDDIITKIQLKTKGENLPGNVTYSISVDNGVTWEAVSRDAEYIVIGTGKHLKIRIRISSATTRIDSLACLYK